ncbi:MAG: hypothetical protein IT385_26975 [Deltaproteobacteria bacterium]|nr:hypothetical protein [Deltaproteobacteria bacterium]
MLQLPSETPEGTAEVIVLVPDARAGATDVDALLATAAAWRSKGSVRRSKEEIDQALREERVTWDAE